jgi:hypothetical protein
MAIHPLAGQPAPQEVLVDLEVLRNAYYDQHPDPENKAQAVVFGTSGHRGTSLNGSFTRSSNSPSLLRLRTVTYRLLLTEKKVPVTCPLLS